MVLDLIRIQNFHYLKETWLKIPFFGVDINSFVNINNKKKEAQYGISFSRSNRKFSLSLDYNETNSFLFVNAKKIRHFKANYTKIKKYYLC